MTWETWRQIVSDFRDYQKSCEYFGALGDDFLVYFLQLFRQNKKLDDIANLFCSKWGCYFENLTLDDWHFKVNSIFRSVNEFSCIGFPQVCGYPANEKYHCNECIRSYNDCVDSDRQLDYYSDLQLKKQGTAPPASDDD